MQRLIFNNSSVCNSYIIIDAKSDCPREERKAFHSFSCRTDFLSYSVLFGFGLLSLSANVSHHVISQDHWLRCPKLTRL